MLEDITIGEGSPGAIPGPVKSDTMSLPLRCFFEAVLPRHSAVLHGLA